MTVESPQQRHRKKNLGQYAQRQRRYRAKNLDACRDSVRRSNYSLPKGWYEKTLAEQGGGCAVCRQPCASGLALAVDHDHRCCAGRKSCGYCVRGLLCRRCNSLLANARECVATLEAAQAYLGKHK